MVYASQVIQFKMVIQYIHSNYIFPKFFNTFLALLGIAVVAGVAEEEEEEEEVVFDFNATLLTACPCNKCI